MLIHNLNHTHKENKMIITQEKNKQVVQSHDFNSVNCTIDAEDMRYVASLLRNNYSNTRLAVVREISANALDANAEANSDRQIEIKLPTNMNPSFSVRDFGGGLSEEDIFGLYSKYGKSTKRDSNNYIGAFGIGKFAPLSYGDNFTCVSYHGGMKRSYNVFVNEDDDTKIVELNKEPSNEPSGLCIEVAVSDGDIDDFRNIAQNFFQFFSEKEMPKFIGVEDNFIKSEEKVLESNNGSWFIVKRERNYYSKHSAHVLMGRVSYPLNSEAINTDNFIKDDRTRSIVDNILNMDGFFLHVPLGSVKLHHSREALEYNKPTQKKIVKNLLVAVEEIQEIAKEKLADSDDLWEAKRNYAKIINSLPYNMRELFKNSFEWQGIKIESSHFDRNYLLQGDLIITESIKELDTSSRNGFKIKSSKLNRAICQDNFLFLIHDLESTHGNNLRVRTLMNEDDSLEGVYILHAKTNSAQSELDNEWQIGRVDKKHIRYSSNVDKEKPQRSGVRKANGGRANIPLFSMNVNSRSYRNADYWSNVSDEISQIENASDVEGSWKDKLVYVPIKNYKISLKEHESWDLDSMKSRMHKIHQADALNNPDKKPIKLFGVRLGDISKLDKNLWVCFDVFYLEFAKEILLNNIDDSNASYTNMLLDDSSREIQNEFHDGVGKLFSSNKNWGFDSLPMSHNLIVAKNSWNKYLINDNSLFRTFVFYVSSIDNEWCKMNLFQQINAKDFKNQLKTISSAYPMLELLGKHWSSWLDPLPNEEKNVYDYISMCDGEGEV